MENEAWMRGWLEKWPGVILLKGVAYKNSSKQEKGVVLFIYASKWVYGSVLCVSWKENWNIGKEDYGVILSDMAK